MYKKRGWFSGLLIFSIGLFFIPSVTQADEPQYPHDYTKRVGRELVFVMLSPIPANSTMASYGYDEKIRSQYTQSGLYKNDGSSIELLWNIDWYAYDVCLSSDGEYLIRWGDWPFDSDYETLAIAFYNRNQEIKAYVVKDLVRKPEKLPHSVSHYRWLKDHAFNDETRTLLVETLHDEKHIFDVTTGEILETVLPPQPSILLTFIREFGWFILCNILGILSLLLFRHLRLNR